MVKWFVGSHCRHHNWQYTVVELLSFHVGLNLVEKVISCAFTNSMLLFFWFPFCRSAAGLLVTPLYGFFANVFHWSLLLDFSLHFIFSSAFLGSLTAQSSHLSCGLPRFPQSSCFFVSDLFGNLLSFILTTCPAHFIRLLNFVFKMYKL